MSQDKLQIIPGDVFNLTADALVFPSNHKPIIGGVIDGQVYKKIPHKTNKQSYEG